MMYLYLLIFLLVSTFTVNASSNSSLDEALSKLSAEQEKSLQKYRSAHVNWQQLPNDEYLEFYTDWIKKNLAEKIELRKQYCEQDEKLCLTRKEQEALKAQARVALKVAELRNDYAKTKPSIADQEQVNNEINRAASVSLCQQHSVNCDDLSVKDRDLVEKLKQRDARIEGMESEFSINLPQWKEKKGEKEVRDFLLRREAQILDLNLQLNADLCRAYPTEKEFCLESKQIEELRADTAKASCLHERVHQVYNLTQEDLIKKEKILTAGHAAQWESLENKDCAYLLSQDRLAKSLAPAPLAPPVEEEYGENEDEKSPRNYIPETCNWVPDLPRKISFLPGCGKQGACIGFVVCDQKEGGAKFVRTSTCSPQHCGSTPRDAINCTKQPGYYTRKPAGEKYEFVSERLKRIFTGTSKQ
jgi:hypothetical protein